MDLSQDTYIVITNLICIHLTQHGRQILTNIFAEATLNVYQRNQIQFGLDFQEHPEHIDRRQD